MARGKRTAAVSEEPVEGPWELPEGWRWERGRSVGAIVGGGTPRNAADPNNYDPDGVAWLTPADLSGYSGATISRGARSLSKEGFANSAARVMPKGTVLISSRAPVGYCAVADGPISTNQGFKNIVPREDIDPFFIRYYVMRAQAYLQENASGTTFKELSGAALGDLAFPVAPTTIQNAVVRRIDELFAEIDEGEAALAEAREETDTYRQALLKAAVTGELTADWRAANAQAETGQALLTRLLAERRARWEADPKNARKRYVEPEGAETGELPELPKSWAVAGFNVVADAVSDAGKKLKERDYAASGAYPVVDQGAKPIAGYTDDVALLQEHAGPLIVFGDHTRRFKFIDFPFCVGADGVKLIAPHSLMDARYLHLALTAAHFEDRGYSRHFQFVRALALPVPPLEEQAVIVSRLTQAFAKLDGLDLAAFRDQAANLRQSILAAAFRGDLLTEPQA